jgi:hypothetical protein
MEWREREREREELNCLYKDNKEAEPPSSID